MSETTHPLVSLVDRFYSLPVLIGNHLQSPLLLVVRLVWGIELVQAGWGKLTHIDTPTAYFTTLHIPFPMANAWLVACTETFGGLFLALGLLSRLTAIPLIFNFIVAYITTEQEALANLLSFDTDKFFAAAPYTFLFAAVLVFVFGPGAYSVDYLISSWRSKIWRSSGI